MNRRFLPNHTLRLSLVFVAIMTLVNIGMAQGTKKPLRCGSDLKLDTVLNHPDDYFGKSVTVEGEMHRTFNDKVFSIEDDDFLRDDDLLIITDSSKADVVQPVKDSIAEGKDVCVTGVIQPFHRSEMESKYGPLNIESRASHYPEGSPVMIIETIKAAATDTVELEKPFPDVPAAEPMTSPAPTDLDTSSDEAQPEPQPEVQQSETPESLPKTASPIPLVGLTGALSLLAAGIRRRIR